MAGRNPNLIPSAKRDAAGSLGRRGQDRPYLAIPTPSGGRDKRSVSDTGLWRCLSAVSSYTPLAMSAPPSTVRRLFPASRNYIRDLWARREFAWYLAMGNLKARNATTTLGLMWWVLNPLLLGAVYWLVFGLLFDRGQVDNEFDFLPFLLSGIFAFFFTQQSMTAGVNSITSNAKLLANISFPRLALPLSALLESFVGFVTSIGVYFLIVGPVNGIWPGVQTLWLFPTILLHLIFNFGLATLVARIAVPFRDLNNLVPYFTRLWLYLSPILYPPSFLEGQPAWVHFTMGLNPLNPFLALYRHAMVGMPVDLGGALLGASAWAVAIAVVGGFWFVKYEGRMARYV